MGMVTTTHTPQTTAEQRRLARPRNNRVLAGVAAAIATATGIATGFVRLAFLALTFLGGFGVLLYAVMWVLLPSDDADASPAEHWLANLRTPGRRTGAVLIGAAALVVLLPFAPLAVIAAGALLIVGLYLTRNNNES
jgi:phage shock protein PspC (stress-responsive transcriptional regulator)